VTALLFAALIVCLILAGIGRYAAVEPGAGRAALRIGLGKWEKRNFAGGSTATIRRICLSMKKS
jgi:hypothetical protein